MLKSALRIAIALVWLLNGVFCKLLGLVPRHQLIVSRILGTGHAYALTKTIGMLELLMALWVFSGIRSRWCSAAQILAVAAMNIIEISLVPDLLLFGRANAFPALLFISVVFVNEVYTGQSRTRAD